MNLYEVPLQVLLVTADGKRNLVSIFDTKLKIGLITNKETKFDINCALMLDQMPSIEQNLPVADNLGSFKNLNDLIRG